MAEKIATRAAYGKALVEFADQEPNLVVLDADLSGSTMTKDFGTAHPDRFFDMGIAEANMVGVAAGLATCGKKPFVNSFAMFAAGRAWEQVRNSVAYPGLNVKVVGSHGGLSVGEDGATHQCIEDLAIMRAIPDMTVLCPCDGHEMRQAVQALLAYDGPAYMRLGRLAVETVTDQIPDYRFEIGKGVLLREGSDVTAGAGGDLCPGDRHAYHQTAGYGNPFDRGPGNRLHCDHGGGQCPGRPGQCSGRVPFHHLSGAGDPPRGGGCLWPFRCGPASSGGLWPDSSWDC